MNNCFYEGQAGKPAGAGAGAGAGARAGEVNMGYVL